MSSNELVERNHAARSDCRVATPEQQAIVSENYTRDGYGRKSCSLTEFVRDAIGDTYGTVIAESVDTTALLNAMKREALSFHRHSRRPPAQATHYGGGRSGESHQHRNWSALSCRAEIPRQADTVR